MSSVTAYPPPPPPPPDWAPAEAAPAVAPRPAPTPPARPSATALAAQGSAEDDRRVHRASVAVGLYIAFATAMILVAGCGAVVYYLVEHSSLKCVNTYIVAPGGGPRGGGDGGFIGGLFNVDIGNDVTSEDAARCAATGGEFGYVIDPAMAVKAIIALCASGVALLGLVGWLVARRAVRPLADALRLQRHFVADASHELRTPLTVLSTRIQLLRRRLARGEDVQPTVDQLRADAAGMADVLNDLLLTVEGSAVTPGVVTPVAQTVREAVESLRVVADQAQVRLQVDVLAEPRVSVQATALSRAVVALADNAIQHSPAGGTVAVSVAMEGAEAAIRVRDQGPGIEGADPNRMFERFAHGQETGRKRSFGLGLALVSEIAQRSRGDISIESTGPQGTTFLLRLPAV